ncbi:MAG: hypothetical protein JNK48_31695, partial [Bryobacterales bacterium]|nr:hypothetical protein [Bryobacterales bacterium]
EAARLYSNLTLFDVQGLDLRKADEHSRKALDYLSKVAADPESRPLRPHVLYARGLAIDRLDPSAGIALFQEASALYSALHREKPSHELHQGMMLCHWRLAARHLVELRPQQALRHSREGLVLAEQSLAAGPASPRRQLAVSTAAGILCWNYIDLRDYASAEPLARRLTAMRERILQEDPGNQQSLAYLAEAFKYLASSRLGLGRFQETRDAAAQAVRIYEEMLAKGTLAPFHRAGLPESRLILADALLSSGNRAEGCAERRRGLAAFHAIGVDQRLKGFRRSIQDAQKAVDECEAATGRPVNPTARKSEDTAPPAQTPQTRP